MSATRCFCSCGTAPTTAEKIRCISTLWTPPSAPTGWARRFGLKEERVRALTRAALLHDFFGYDWQSERHKRYMHRYSGWQRVRRMHAFIHGSHAARRAGRLFDLDQRQRDAIASHMFPLASWPKSSEAWLLTLADKMVASREVGETVGWHVKGWCRKLTPARSRRP